jgi:ABC-type multidrug transport system fused ATPase/permease subunit
MGVLGGIAIITFASIYLLPQKILSPEALFTFGMYLVRMLPIVSLVYSIRGQLIFMAEGLFEVERWLETPQHPAVPFGNRKFEFLKSYLSFEGITYSYPNGKLAVENVTFDVRKGQTVALVGSSGSGKTTLANLLLRMRTPASGAIIVDGISHWEFTPESWHRRVATVEQDAFLFHTTLKENICFGLEDVPDEKVWEVLEMSQLSEWVQTLPDGLNTIVGERGASLSGGQRQRLAIARALVRDPEILVLDEATSALDSVSERLVQEALDNAQKGRTVLVIAHRLSTIRHADKIIVLEQGRIVEKGSWNELQDLGGAFANYVHSSQAY